jgi:hypothetical protein
MHPMPNKGKRSTFQPTVFNKILQETWQCGGGVHILHLSVFTYYDYIRFINLDESTRGGKILVVLKLCEFGFTCHSKNLFCLRGICQSTWAYFNLHITTIKYCLSFRFLMNWGSYFQKCIHLEWVNLDLQVIQKTLLVPSFNCGGLE